MSDELNLTLPEKKQKNGKMPWWIPVLLGLILIACLLQLVHDQVGFDVAGGVVGGFDGDVR